MRHPGAEFKSLVTSFAAGASASLKQGESPIEADGSATPEDRKPERSRQALETARQLIDTLAMLEEKTQGNLDDGERELLQVVLTDLRMRYVKHVGAGKATSGAT
jgi:hypothetical protein